MLRAASRVSEVLPSSFLTSYWKLDRNFFFCIPLPIISSLSGRYLSCRTLESPNYRAIPCATALIQTCTAKQPVFGSGLLERDALSLNSVACCAQLHWEQDCLHSEIPWLQRIWLKLASRGWRALENRSKKPRNGFILLFIELRENKASHNMINMVNVKLNVSSVMV